jgi:guanosine-diphosphatase
MLRPGLSFFKGNPTGAADSLRPLLQTSMDSIPASLRSCTPIAVKATAGLRLLGQTESRSILKEVRRMIKEEYPFQLADGRKGEGLTELTGDGGAGRAVEIMEGKDEGVFAWITVNYLLGLIGPPLPGHTRDSQKHTAAVMDLGGASTQIVFEPKYADGEQGMRPGEHVYELKGKCGPLQATG